MNLRHPSEYFVKYLLTLQRPEALNDGWICDRVKDIGYPAPMVPYVQDLRAALMADFPVNFDPTDRYNRASVKYLSTHGIRSLHAQSDGTKEAIMLLQDSQVRPVLEKLLLGRVAMKEIAIRLNTRFNKFLTEEEVRDYGHYFFNVSVMKIDAWMVFFDQYNRIEQQKSLAILQGGGAMALHVAGFKQDFDTKDMLKDMMETIVFDFKDWKNAPRSLDKTRALATLAKAATGIDERLSESSTAVRDHLALFKQWQMTHAPGVVKGIDDVAPHGNFSESGADLKELPEKTK